MSVSEQSIFVTGATGNTGNHIVRFLTEKNIPWVAGLRTPRKLVKESEMGEYKTFDFCDPSTYHSALKNCWAVFLVRPPHLGNLNDFIDILSENGIKYVIFLSVIGAGERSYIPHHKIEKRIVESGISWTFLRAGFFAQNLGDKYRNDIVSANHILLPSGDGKAAFVDVRDVAEAASLIFADPEKHFSMAYNLTGGEALSFHEVALHLSHHLSTSEHPRDIKYEACSIWTYFHHLRSQGLAFSQCLVYTMLHVGLRKGDAEEIDPTLENLLGRKPTTIEMYIRDHISLWLVEY